MKSQNQHNDQKTILIVDDDKPLAEVYKVALEVEGYHVVMKYDGEDALRWLASEEVDLIIMDCMLPKFSGLSVMEALTGGKPKAKTPPIIVVTGLDRPEYRVRAEELGAIKYLVKANASISEMIDAVNEGIEAGRVSRRTAKE